MKNIPVPVLINAINNLPEISDYLFNQYLIELNLEKLTAVVDDKPLEPVNSVQLTFQKSIDKKEWELVNISSW